jgi:hypothetical protein
MKRIILLGCLILFLSGCTTLKPNPILISKDESWLMPPGTEFQATKKDGEPVKTLKADDWLMVLYLGSYLEVEKKANSCSH